MDHRGSTRVFRGEVTFTSELKRKLYLHLWRSGSGCVDRWTRRRTNLVILTLMADIHSIISRSTGLRLDRECSSVSRQVSGSNRASWAGGGIAAGF